MERGPYSKIHAHVGLPDGPCQKKVRKYRGYKSGKTEKCGALRSDGSVHKSYPCDQCGDKAYSLEGLERHKEKCSG